MEVPSEKLMQKRDSAIRVQIQQGKIFGDTMRYDCPDNFASELEICLDRADSSLYETQRGNLQIDWGLGDAPALK